MLEYMKGTKDYETRALLIEEQLGLLKDSVKQQKEIEKAKDRITLALRQNIAMKHGRKYTGRKRGRPKKLVGADGAPLVAPSDRLEAKKRKRRKGSSGNSFRMP
jgi:hypothetical protein